MGLFLYRIQPVRPEMLTSGSTETESRLVDEHFSYLKNLVENGTVMMAGRTQNKDYSSFGLVIFKANSDEEAREIMLNDPAVKNRVFRGELFPYRISLFKPENV
jgi:uncharacterized protein YciI